MTPQEHTAIIAMRKAKQKECTACKIVKPRVQFYVCKQYADGRDYQCIECCRKRALKNYHKRKKPVKERTLKVCTMCQQALPRDEFKQYNKYFARCKPCRAEYDRQKQAEYRAERTARMQAEKAKQDKADEFRPPRPYSDSWGYDRNELSRGYVLSKLALWNENYAL